MKKRIVSLVLTLALCLGLAVPALALGYGEEYAGYPGGGASQQYRDVPETHWAFQSIATCSQRTWFNGYPDGTFRPEGLITREEAAKVFAVAMGLEIEPDPTVTFTDTADNWAKAYIEATKPLFPNVANLQGTTSFRPKQTITREETIYALVIAWGYGSKTTNADLSILNMFSDTSSISAGVKPYMAVAVSEGLVAGLPDGTIAAQKGLTRAEFATLLARALSHGYGDTKQEFQAPKLTLNKYSATTDKATLTVTGSVTPADATVTLDGSDVRVSNGSFSVELELKVGSNSFTLTAENAYGTKASKTIAVERTDELTISLNTFDAKTEAEEVTLSGTVTPAGGATLTVDGAEVPTTSTGSFQVTLPLEIGANVFEFSAKNTNGTTAAKSAKITREFAAPQPEPTQEPEDPSGSAAATAILQIDPNRPLLSTGKCGDNMEYALYNDGELVIGGTGKMYDYESSSAAPWSNYRKEITDVTLGNGITSIGNYAFYNLYAVTQVAIPYGVETIGDHAFDNTGLTSLAMPSSVTGIGHDSFFGCTSLTNVTLSESLTAIGRSAFSNTALTQITIPDGVTEIGDGAFLHCYDLHSVHIPASVTTIGEYAFFNCFWDLENNCRSGMIYYAGTSKQWENIHIKKENHLDSVPILTKDRPTIGA